MTHQKCHRRQKGKERSLKYQNQQRVPFSDSYYDDENEGAESVNNDDIDGDDYDDNPIRYHYCFCGEECESDDSAKEYDSVNPLRPVQLKNRYALLLDDDEDENNTSASNNDIANENSGEESDYEVFQNTNGKKSVKITGKSKVIESDPKKRRLSQYKKKKWINSWCKNGNNDKEMFSVHVDGFFRKNRKAGYGVIVRYHSGFPLVASVGVEEKPVSALYHELQGVNRGLELAIKYGIRDVKVRTTSFASATLVRKGIEWFGYSCFCPYSSRNSSTFGTCEKCVWNHKRFIEGVGHNSRLGVYPLLQEIVGKCVMFKQGEWKRKVEWFMQHISYVGRNRNKAADYLAKLQKRKEEMSPIEFPKQLKDILYEDAVAGMCKRTEHRTYW